MVKRAVYNLDRAVQQVTAPRSGKQLAQADESVEVGTTAVAGIDTTEQTRDVIGAGLAGRTLATGVVGEEVHILGNPLDDAGPLRDHDHGACAQGRAPLRHRFEIERHVQVLGGQDRVGRTAGEDGFELQAHQHAAAVVKDQFLQRRAHRQFIGAGPEHVAAETVDLGTGGGTLPQALEPRHAVADDVRDVRQGLGVVDQRRKPMHTGFRRVRRLVPGEGKLALHRLDGSSLLAADVMPGRRHDAQFQRPPEVFDQGGVKIGAPPLGDRRTHAGQRLFLVRVDVEHDVIDVAGDGADRGPLDHLVRGLGEQDAVLEGAGLVLVAVDDQVLLADIAPGSQELPLAVGRKATAAEAAQAGVADHRDQFLRRLAQGHPQSLAATAVTPRCEVGTDALPGVQQYLVQRGHGVIPFSSGAGRRSLSHFRTWHT